MLKKICAGLYQLEGTDIKFTKMRNGGKWKVSNLNGIYVLNAETLKQAKQEFANNSGKHCLDKSPFAE